MILLYALTSCFNFGPDQSADRFYTFFFSSWIQIGRCSSIRTEVDPWYNCLESSTHRGDPH